MVIFIMALYVFILQLNQDLYVSSYGHQVRPKQHMINIKMLCLALHGYCCEITFLPSKLSDDRFQTPST